MLDKVGDERLARGAEVGVGLDNVVVRSAGGEDTLVPPLDDGGLRALE